MELNPTGKKITSIRIYKNKVVIYLSKEKIDISKETYASMYLYKGKELSFDTINKLKSSLNEEVYIKYALKLISRRYYSSHLLKEKLLAKGANRYIVNKTIKYLKDNKLLDDKELTINYIESLSNSYYGINRIKSYLFKKGLDYSLCNTFLNKEKEIEKCKAYYPIAIKKFISYPINKQKESISRHLLTKGYELDVIKTVLKDEFKYKTSNNSSSLNKDALKAYNMYKDKYDNPYEINKHVIDKLKRKGYSYKDIKIAMEEINYDFN